MQTGPSMGVSWLLTHELADLLHNLLSGHILNPNLDMQRMFTFGMVTTLRLWDTCQLTVQHGNDLGQLLLKRMAKDERLTSSRFYTSQSAAAARMLETVLHLGLKFCKWCRHASIAVACDVSHLTAQKSQAFMLCPVHSAVLCLSVVSLLQPMPNFLCIFLSADFHVDHT